MHRTKLFVPSLSAVWLAALGGCSTAPVLIFGQSHSVGISISGSTTDAGAELSVGYKDRDVAVVPVAIVSKNGTVDAATLRVNSTVGETADGRPDTDALSVLGQFDVNAKGNDPQVALGKFFATGLAAQKLADGFACKLSDASKCPGGEPVEERAPPATAASSKAVAGPISPESR